MTQIILDSIKKINYLYTYCIYSLFKLCLHIYRRTYLTTHLITWDRWAA